MESDFQRMQREATERLRKMSERARENGSPATPEAEPKSAGQHSTTGGDILSSLFNGSSDGVLLAGLLLLLYRDKGDKLLMLALLFILM